MSEAPEDEIHTGRPDGMLLGIATGSGFSVDDVTESTYVLGVRAMMTGGAERLYVFAYSGEDNPVVAKMLRAAADQLDP